MPNGPTEGAAIRAETRSETDYPRRASINAATEHAASPASVPDALANTGESKKILIVLPYSGAQFTGGLAVLNEQLTNALKENGHDVKLLTCRLSANLLPNQESHGGADLLFIEPPEIAKAVGPLDDKQRNALYEHINSKDVLSRMEVRNLFKDNGGWEPEFILGHSRFSGPAAILLHRILFPKSKVGYFLHSYPPVEGMLLSGYNAFEEPVDVNSAERKLKEEKKWIGEADIVFAMGPLLRWGATLILKEVRESNPRIHEVISGVSEINYQDWPKFSGEDPTITLILSGRASAPVKGFQDIVISALQLRNNQYKGFRSKPLKYSILIKVRGMGRAVYGEENATPDRPKRTVDHESVQEWVDGVFSRAPSDKNDKKSVTVKVMGLIGQDDIIGEYQSAHGVLSAAYLEHFGLVPFEALGSGRPVLVSEFSGSGQFLSSRYGKRGELFVVKDFKRRPSDSAALDIKNFTANAFDNRPNAWERAIRDLVNDYPRRADAAKELRDSLRKQYTLKHFAKSILDAFEDRWFGKITRQISDGKIQEVPKNEQ